MVAADSVACTRNPDSTSHRCFTHPHSQDPKSLGINVYTLGRKLAVAEARGGTANLVEIPYLFN